MAQGKKSFILYSDMRGSFDKLPDELAGKLIKHIFAYVNDENPVSEDYTINAVFDQLEKALKRDLEKWEAQLEQRSEAGKISAEKRRLAKLEAERIANETQRKATTVEIRHNEAQRNSSDNCNMLSVNCNMEDVSTKVDFVSVVETGVSPPAKKETKRFVKPSIEDIYFYCQERKNNVDATKFFNHYESNGWKVGKNPMKDWKASIRTWETNNLNNGKSNGTTQNISRGSNAVQGQRRTYTAEDASF